MKLQPGSFALTALLASMTAIGPVSMNTYLASLPHIGAALGASTSAVQATFSVYLLGFAAGQLIYGPLSDFYGRRAPLLIGFAIYLIATFACAAAPTIEILIAARFLQALGAAGPIILARTIVRDFYEGDRAARQLGVMSTVTGVSPIIAPVLGGILEAAFGWRSSFIAMAAIALPVAATAWLLLPETNLRRLTERPSVGGLLKGYRIVARDKAYLAYLGLLVMTSIGHFAYLAGSSHVLQRFYGLGPIAFGFAMMLSSTSYVVGAFTGSRLVSRMRIEPVIGFAANFMLIGGLLQILGYLLLPASAWAFVLPQMLFYCGAGFMLPQTIAGALTPFPERAGSASSLIGFIQMTIGAAVGVMLGASLGSSAWPLILAIAFGALGAFAVYHLTSRTRRAAALDR